MNTKKMIAVMAVLAMAVAAFAFAPVVVDGAEDKEIVYMNGEVTSTLSGTPAQLVIIDKDMTVKTGGSVTIEGDLLVKEGVTVTIEDGVFTITGDATINGTIISKIGAVDTKGLVIKPATDKEVTINGVISALGDTSGTNVKSVKMDATNGKITVNGSVAVGTNAEVEFTKVVFEKNAALTVLGTAKGDISVYGTVNFDGKTEETFAISLAEASAIINIASVEGTISITDSQMFAYAYGGVQYYVDLTTETALEKKAVAEITESGSNTLVAANTITFKDVENVKVTETVTTSIEYDEKTSQNMMVAATAMIFAPLDSAKAVEGGVATSAIATNGTTIYFETMTLNDVLLTLGGANVIIKGDVTYPLQDTSISTGYKIANGCTDALEIPGSLAILKATGYTLHPLEGTNVEAAYYSVKDADNNVNFYYTTAQKAIDAGATDITMMGQLVVEKDLTVPAPVKLTTDTTLTTSPATSEEQYAVIIKDGAALTIANGAQFIAKGDVNVEGTFVIENIDYGITLKLIWADVELKDGSYIMYTNLANAFAKAEAGAELNAYNPVNGKIIIDKDLTVPAGMTFSNEGAVVYSSDAKMKGIEVGKAVVLTVAGKLIMNDDAKLTCENGSSWNSSITKTEGGAVVDCSVVAIGPQGVIEFDNKTSDSAWDKRIVAGAYFVDETNYYITNIPLAFSGILNTESKTVYIAGEVTIDTSVTGTEKDRVTVELEATADVTMKGFTFAYATVNAAPDAILTGDIGTATGKMIFNEAKVTAAAAFTEEFINDAMNFKVAGTFQSNNVTEISGIVYLGTFGYTTDSNATGYNLLTYAEKRFTVPAGTALFVNAAATFNDVELLIAGEATVMKSASLSVTAGYLSVTGTLTVAKTDGTAGTVTAGNIIVGGSTDSFDKIADLTTGNALVTGAGSFTLTIDALYVFKGASVTADVLADWMANTAKSTEFYVDGALWMTAYASAATAPAVSTLVFAEGEEKTVSTTTVVLTKNLITPALTNVEFNGWQTYDEKTKTYTDVVAKDKNDKFYVGAAGYEKIYADLSKDIYTIVITADVGIDNIYIDGVIMTKVAYNNTFNMDVAAGSHTISYELANGYSGNAYITSIDGKTLVGSGLSFTVDDDKYDSVKDKMDITLSGIVKSGIDVDPETHPEKSTGLTVTEILLIVVVIIMAIMAVVLILRLNRS